MVPILYSSLYLVYSTGHCNPTYADSLSPQVDDHSEIFVFELQEWMNVKQYNMPVSEYLEE